MKKKSRRRHLLRAVFLVFAVVSVVIILGGALGVGIVVYISGVGTGRDVTLAWEASTSPNVGGYRIHYGPSSGNYPNKVRVGDQTSYTLSGLDVGRTYYIAVTALEADGTGESDFSDEIVVKVPEEHTDGDSITDTH